MGEDGGEGVGGEGFGTVHLPEQVEGGEALRGGGQEVRLLQEHHQHRAHPEMVGLGEVVVEGGRQALERVAAGLLRQDAQEVGQLLPAETHREAAAADRYSEHR